MPNGLDIVIGIDMPGIGMVMPGMVPCASSRPLDETRAAATHETNDDLSTP